MRTRNNAERWAVRLAALCALAIAAPSGAQPSAEQSALGAAAPSLNFDSAVAAAAAMPRLDSLLVDWNGDLVLEHYFNGRDATDTVNVKSVSKSVISTLVGIAIERGHISGVDQPIGDYFADLLTSESDAAKRQITIDNLLTMQSGLETTSNRNYGAWVLSPHWVRFALRQPLEAAPGTRMIYSTGNTHLLSAILTQATGKSTLAFAREVFAEPLGFRLPSWQRDPQGIYFGGNEMLMTPRQMIAFGRLYLDGGKANGKQIVPSAWIDASLEPRAESTREEGRYYGYGWWIRETAGLRSPYAWGYGGQFILLVPTLDLVVVTTSDSTPGADRRSHRRRVLDLLEALIVAPAAQALGSPASLAAGEG